MLIPWSYPPDEWLIYHQVEQLYQRGGYTALITQLQIAKKCQSRNRYVDRLVPTGSGGFTFSWKHTVTEQNRVIVKILQTRRQLRTLLRRYIAYRETQRHDYQVMNETDLYGNCFTEVDFLEIREGGKKFRFSHTDIKNLLTQALETRSELRSTPSYPKNPYTNQPFHAQVISKFYQVLESESQQLPNILVLFKMAGFNIDNLHHRFSGEMDYLACYNYTVDNFQTDDRTNLFYDLVEEMYEYTKDKLTGSIPTKSEIRYYCRRTPITHDWYHIIASYLYISYYLTTTYRKRPFVIHPKVYDYYLGRIIRGLTTFSQLIKQSFQLVPAKFGHARRARTLASGLFEARSRRNYTPTNSQSQGRTMVIGEGLDISFRTHPTPLATSSDEPHRSGDESQVLVNGSTEIITSETEDISVDSITLPLVNDSPNISILSLLFSEIDPDHFRHSG